MPTSLQHYLMRTRASVSMMSGNLPLWFYGVVHLGAFAAPVMSPSAAGIGWAAALYVVRNLALIVGYHRYFAHRSFRTSRSMQAVLAVCGLTAAEGGPLWWAQKHRRHHLHSDDAADIHSPHVQGFLYAHSGWFLDSRHQATDLTLIGDFAKYPELRWLDRCCPLVQLGMLVILYFTGGWNGVLWGYCVSTVAVWHSTHMIQSVAHLWGARSYATRDESRNSLVLGLLILGDGWHNNHHYYPSSARHGFHWRQPDPAYLVIVGLEALGLAWDVKRPSPAILQGKHPALLRSLATMIVATQELRSRSEAFWTDAGRECTGLAAVPSPCWEFDQIQHDLSSWLEQGPRKFRLELTSALERIRAVGCQRLDAAGLSPRATEWNTLLEQGRQGLLASLALRPARTLRQETLS